MSNPNPTKDLVPLSRRESLAGLTALRDNPFYQMFQEAAEHEVQRTLTNILSPDAINSQDGVTVLLQNIGEMRGLRGPHRYLTLAIARLTEEVQNEEQSQPTEKN